MREITCPHCGDHGFTCRHLVLAWSPVAQQWESFGELPSFRACVERLVHGLKVLQQQVRNPNDKSLWRLHDELCRSDQEWPLDTGNRSHAINYAPVADFLLDWIDRYPDLNLDDGEECAVWFAMDPQQVVQAFDSVVRQIELEAAEVVDCGSNLPTKHRAHLAMLGVPPEEFWVIARLAKAVAKRLVHGSDDENVRRGLMQCLWTLQRIPMFDRRANIGVSCRFANRGIYGLRFDDQGLGLSEFDDGTTTLSLCYFPGSQHCMHYTRFLEEDERARQLEYSVNEFASLIEDPDVELSIEDYTDDSLRAPPMRIVQLDAG